MSTLLHKRVWKSFLCVLNWQPGNWIERDVAVWVYSWNWTEWQLQPVRKRGRHLVLFTTPQLIWILWHMSVVFCSKHICQLLFFINYRLLKWNKKYVVELGSLSNATFSFLITWRTDVHPVQNLLLCTKFHRNRMIFHRDMAIYRFSKWRPSAILELFYHHTRPPTKSLLLVTAACQISEYIWISRTSLKCLFRPPKWEFWGTLYP